MGERKIPFKSKVVYYMDIDEIPVFFVHKISFFFHRVDVNVVMVRNTTVFFLSFQRH